MYAAVGVTETTTEPRPYAFPGNDKIKIWDLPGANTNKFPISRYAEEMNFKDYQAFIILTKDRFYETDKEIARQIRDLGKPFFFARTQMDTTMKNEAEDRGRKFNEEETKEMIRNNCREELDDPEQEIYLIYLRIFISFILGHLFHLSQKIYLIHLRIFISSPKSPPLLLKSAKRRLRSASLTTNF